MFCSHYIVTLLAVRLGHIAIDTDYELHMELYSKVQKSCHIAEGFSHLSTNSCHTGSHNTTNNYIPVCIFTPQVIAIAAWEAYLPT